MRMIKLYYKLQFIYSEGLGSIKSNCFVSFILIYIEFFLIFKNVNKTL